MRLRQHAGSTQDLMGAAPLRLPRTGPQEAAYGPTLFLLINMRWAPPPQTPPHIQGASGADWIDPGGGVLASLFRRSWLVSGYDPAETALGVEGRFAAVAWEVVGRSWASYGLEHPQLAAEEGRKAGIGESGPTLGLYTFDLKSWLREVQDQAVAPANRTQV